MSAAERQQTRLHIDWTRCDGRGLCTELLPGVLRRDPWGYPLARDGSREPAIPAAALRDARAAVARCPRLALSVIAPTPKTVEQQVNSTGRHGR